jgi:hypothetical protein
MAAFFAAESSISSAERVKEDSGKRLEGWRREGTRGRFDGRYRKQTLTCT